MKVKTGLILIAITLFLILSNLGKEKVPIKETDPKVIEFFMIFGDITLGKQAVLCRDTPAFIANRIGTYGMMSILDIARRNKLSVEDVDAVREVTPTITCGVN